MDFDRRQEDRCGFHMEDCQGTFTLELDDEPYEIEDVFDISLSGIGIETLSYIEPDTAVTVSYAEGDTFVTVSGVVSWCDDEPQTQGNYRLGVLFDFSYRDNSSQLFMAVRKYLESFDEKEYN